MNYRRIKLTEKQYEALQKIATYTIVNLAGGARSGKTFVALYAMVIRALKYPGLVQLVIRFRFSHAKQAICYQTMPKLIELLGLRGHIKLNKTEWFYEFENGSQIWIGGLDDKERLEKILGNEYATIFANEASQISFDGYEFIITRLNPPHGVKGKILVDYNPPTISHWSYKMFVKHQYPDGSPVDRSKITSIRMNPQDNKENLSDDYIDMLETLSAAKRQRFLYGEYTADGGTLWKREWFKYHQEYPELQRIIVGVDPAGTVDGDEVGIIVAGVYKDEYFVLNDYSCHGTPQEWANEVAAAYHRYEADMIVAEKNFGGDMVEATIKSVDGTLPVKLVNASRGKLVRAEPISVLYEKGLVYHVQRLPELEDELCMYDPLTSDSPNRMDALVWCISEMVQESNSPSMLLQLQF
jgi:hypothetical protein